MTKSALLLLVIVTGLCACKHSQQLTQSNYTTNGDTLVYNPSALNFIVMGDWGRNGADHQKQVAAQMAIAATKVNSQFVITTGDNIYPSGVVSEWDPLWRYSFEDIYTDFHLQWDWYPVLGNHDYKTNPDAEVRYSNVSRRWKMPARYYAKKIPIGSDTTNQILFAFMDTNPFIPEYYRNAEYGPNVRTQDTVQQKRWLINTLGDNSNVRWKIVVAHHPMYTGGGRTDGYDTKAIRGSLKPVFDNYGVDVYLAGHEHSLQHLADGTKTQHFISGAASEKTPVHTIPESKFVASDYGFMVFSVTKDSMNVSVVNYRGNIIYKTTIKK